MTIFPEFQGPIEKEVVFWQHFEDDLAWTKARSRLFQVFYSSGRLGIAVVHYQGLFS